jgi:hypothetical protein
MKIRHLNAPGGRADVKDLESIKKNLKKFDEHTRKKRFKMSNEFLKSPAVMNYNKSCDQLIRSLKAYQDKAAELKGIAQREIDSGN